MDKRYDLFIAGIQAEHQGDADQIINEFVRLFPEYQNLTEALRRSPPLECRLARKIDLQQAESRQRQLARLGLICRYRPAVDQQPAFSLEPLAPQTITCPFCQHSQPKPEKPQGKRCANCNAKMSLFEKRQKILEKMRTQKAAASFTADEKTVIAEPPVTQIIRQAEQKQHRRRKQQLFSFSLLGFTLTAILAITGFAVYQLSLPPNPALSTTSNETPIDHTVLKSGSWHSASPLEHRSIRQKDLNTRLLSRLSADELLTAAINQPAAPGNGAQATLDSLFNRIAPSETKKLMAALETERLLNPADVKSLVASLKQPLNSMPDNETRSQLLKQLQLLSPIPGNADEVIVKPYVFNVEAYRPDKPEQDIFAVLYAMEAFNQANTKNSEIHRLLRQYTLQKKFLQQYRVMFTQALNKSLNIHENIPDKLHESLMRWLYPEIANVILSARSNPVTLDVLPDKHQLIPDGQCLICGQ